METKTKKAKLHHVHGDAVKISHKGRYFTVSRPADVKRMEEKASASKLDSSPKKKVCDKHFRIYQEILTQGAVNMDVFEIGNTTYLAVANFHRFNSKSGYHTNSYVYRMNPVTDLFELYQELPSFGCRALVSFVRDGTQYLVAANHYDGHKHSLSSVIYKWDGMKFQDYQHVRTYGASAAQFFTIDGEDFLLFANYRNKTTVSVSSVVYKWTNDRLETFQMVSPFHTSIVFYLV